MTRIGGMANINKNISMNMLKHRNVNMRSALASLVNLVPLTPDTHAAKFDTLLAALLGRGPVDRMGEAIKDFLQQLLL